MSVLNVLIPLFLGFGIGIVVTALMFVSRESNAEIAGAGKLADTVMEVIDKWEALGWDGVKPTRYECVDAIYHIKMHAKNAQIAADEQDEKDFNMHSTNG